MPNERLGRPADEVRAGVVRARLSNLMAVLGDVPSSSVPATGWAGPVPPGEYRCGERLLPRAVPGDALGRVIDCVVPTGLIVVHNRKLPDGSAALEHIVVARRGLVVVGPSWVPSDASAAIEPEEKPSAYCGLGRPAAARTGHRRHRSGRAERRSEVVRGAVRRAGSLRQWLEGSAWQDIPVMAAVCTAPTTAYVAPPPVLLDGLWVGAVERLPSWLASGSALTAAERAAIGYYLVSELPDAHRGEGRGRPRPDR